MVKQLQVALLRKKEVIERTKLCSSTLYNLMGDGAFPRPIQVGPRAVRWIEAEVQAYIEQCIHSRNRSGMLK